MLADMFNKNTIKRHELKRMMIDIYGLLDDKAIMARRAPLNEIANYIEQADQKDNIFSFIRNIENPAFWN